MRLGTDEKTISLAVVVIYAEMRKKGDKEKGGKDYLDDEAVSLAGTSER